MRITNCMKSIELALVACLLMIAATNAGAEWQPDPDDKVQSKAYKALVQLKDRLPRTEQYFEEAYGYAVLPSVTRIGLGFGGTYGRGLVVEGGKGRVIAKDLGPGHVIVTLLCDSAMRYRARLFNRAFLAGKGLELPAWLNLD